MERSEILALQVASEVDGVAIGYDWIESGIAREVVDLLRSKQ